MTLQRCRNIIFEVEAKIEKMNKEEQDKVNEYISYLKTVGELYKDLSRGKYYNKTNEQIANMIIKDAFTKVYLHNAQQGGK